MLEHFVDCGSRFYKRFISTSLLIGQEREGRGKDRGAEGSYLPGTVCRILRMRDFAHSDIGALSGNEYMLALILL